MMVVGMTVNDVTLIGWNTTDRTAVQTESLAIMMVSFVIHKMRKTEKDPCKI